MNWPSTDIPAAQVERIEALAATAAAWADPDHPPRAEATRLALAGPHRWTAEGIDFEVNRLCDALTADAIAAQVAGEWQVQAEDRVVERDEPIPLSGLEQALGGALRGGRVIAALGPVAAAFVAAWGERLGARAVELAAPSETVIASRGVALLTGHENADALSGFAEDLLLHDGRARRSVVQVFAPEVYAPDALLAALDAFRELVPAHPAVDGTLRMPRAFLASSKQPHAWGDGYLISRGEPEWLGEGHVRWSEYADRQGAERWVRERTGELSVVVAAGTWALGSAVRSQPGSAHRRPLQL